MAERKTARQREREGAFLGVIGVAIALFGFATGVASAVGIGGIAAVAGLVMWGAAMARPD